MTTVRGRTLIVGGLLLGALRLGAAEPPPAAIPVRAAAYFLDPRAGHLTRTLVVFEVKTDGLTLRPREGRLDGELETAVTVTASGKSFGGAIEREAVRVPPDARERNVWYRLSREISLPPGPAELRVKVRDASGLEGELLRSLDVPEPSGWRLSTPIVSDSVVVDPRVATQRHAVPGVEHAFLAAAILRGEIEVYGAALDAKSRLPRVTLGYSVLRADRVVRALPPAVIPPVEHRSIGSIELSLAGLKAGDYELVLQVADEVAPRKEERRIPFTVARPAAPSAASYEDALRDYAEAREAEALRAVVSWPPAALAGPVHGLTSEGGLHRAGILLHSEAALELLSHGQGTIALEHLALARDLAQRLEKETPFREAWLLAVASELQARWEHNLAATFFEECHTAFPRSALAWLGEGTVYEFSAFPSGISGSRVAGTSESLARDAERAYLRALEIDPALTEARVRLGRVLGQEGRNPEARRELERAVKNAGSGVTPALAHLFLGGTEEAIGASDDAMREYRAALAADPSLQPAAVALSALLVSRGERAEGVEVLRQPLQNGCAVDLPPWLAYHVGLGAREDQRLARLRAQVRS